LRPRDAWKQVPSFGDHAPLAWQRHLLKRVADRLPDLGDKRPGINALDEDRESVTHVAVDPCNQIAVNVTKQDSIK
jgi:hypothetical protein